MQPTSFYLPSNEVDLCSTPAEGAAKGSEVGSQFVFPPTLFLTPKVQDNRVCHKTGDVGSAGRDFRASFG